MVHKYLTKTHVDVSVLTHHIAQVITTSTPQHVSVSASTSPTVLLTKYLTKTAAAASVQMLSVHPENWLILIHATVSVTITKIAFLHRSSTIKLVSVDVRQYVHVEHQKYGTMTSASVSVTLLLIHVNIHSIWIVTRVDANVA